MLMDMDQEIFQECQRRFHEEETNVIHTQKKHEMTWQYLEEVAASKDLSCRFVSCAHWILQVLDSRGYLLIALSHSLWPSMALLAEIVQAFIWADLSFKVLQVGNQCCCYLQEWCDFNLIVLLKLLWNWCMLWIWWQDFSSLIPYTQFQMDLIDMQNRWMQEFYLYMDGFCI